MDVFAVSLGIGTGNRADDFRSRFRLAWHFGLFQAMMTVVGFWLGSTIINFISAFDHWLALGLLAYVGINMIRSGVKKEDEGEKEETRNPSKGRMLILLSVATSLDALAVGLSLAMMGADIVPISVLIGVVSSVLSVVGLLFGAKLGEKFGKRMEIIGGIILIGIGLRVLTSHLFFS